MTGRTILILGGARSGKSTFAERKCIELGGERIYLATAEALDDEMRQRIAQHRGRRGGDWKTVEAPIDLLNQLEAYAHAGSTVLVDCVTLWLSNLMGRDMDPQVAIDRLAAGLHALKGNVVLVSNEVGLGIVPDNALARAFRDVAGLANQRLAAAADEVYFVVAGIPMRMK